MSDLHRDEPDGIILRPEKPGLATLSAWPEADGWVCNVLVRRNGRVLMLRRRDEGFLGGTWDFPGGKADPGEQPAAAAMREFTEETGLTGVLAGEIGHWSYPDTGGRPFRFHTATFGVIEDDPTAEVRLTEEHTDYRWVTAEEAETLPVSWHVRRALEAWGEEAG